MFIKRQEAFGLRKYKGYGLSSAVVGLSFLVPSVMAEETTNVHATNLDNTAVKPAVDGENVAPKSLKPNTTTPPHTSNAAFSNGSDVVLVPKISKVDNDQLEHKGDVVKPNQPGITISKDDDGIADENAHVMFKKPDENASAEELWNIVQNMPDDFQNNERSYLRNLESLGDELNLQPGEIKELNNLGGWHAIDKEGNAGKFAIGKKNEQGYFTGWYIDKDGKRQEGGMLGSDALDNLYVHEQGLDRRFEYILMLAKGRTRANRNDVTTDGSDYDPRVRREYLGLSKEDFDKLSNSEKAKVYRYSPNVVGYNGIEKTFSAFATDFGSRIKLDFATGHLSEFNKYKGGYRIVVKARNKAGAETKVYDETIRETGLIIQNKELIDKGLNAQKLNDYISELFKNEFSRRRYKILSAKVKDSVLKDKKRKDYTDEDKQLHAELFEQALAEAKAQGDITLPIDKDFLSIANASKTDSAWHKSFDSTPVSLATTLNIEMEKTLTDDTVDSDTPMWRLLTDPKSKADDRLYRLFQTLIPGVKSIVYHVKDGQLEVATERYSYKASRNGSKEIGIQGSDIEGTAGADTYHLTDESYEIVRTNTGLNNHYNGWARLIKHDSQTNNDVVNEDFAHFGYMIGVDKGILRTNVRSDNELSEKITAAIGGDMDKLGKAGYFSTGDIHLDKDVVSYTVQVSVADNNSVGVNTQSSRLTYNVPLLADFSVIQDTVEPSRSVVEKIVPKLTIPQKEKDKLIEEIKKKKKTSEFTELISGNVKVRYVDENGNLLSLKNDAGIGEKESDGTYITNKRQLIGTSYDVTDKKLSSMTTIDGKYYKFKEASADSANLTGDVIREGRTVTLVYKESEAPTTATVTANYYKEGTTEKLADSETLPEQEIGSNYTTSPKVIDPVVKMAKDGDKIITTKTIWTLKEVPADKDGTVPAGGKEVNYYYVKREEVIEVPKPVEPPVPIRPSQPTAPKDLSPAPTQPQSPTEPNPLRNEPRVPVTPTEPKSITPIGEAPVKPTEPLAPTSPMVPTQPVTIAPKEPVTPTAPPKPGAPEPVLPPDAPKVTKPVVPQEPTTLPPVPKTPQSPIEPRLLPTEPTEPKAPTKPEGLKELGEEPMKPLAPKAPVQPTLVNKPGIAPVSPSQPQPPVKPGQPSIGDEPKAPSLRKPVEPMKPIAPAEPKQPVAPTMPIAPRKSIGDANEPSAPEYPLNKPTEPIAPVVPRKPNEPTPPMVQSKSSAPGIPVLPAQPSLPKAPEFDPMFPARPTQPRVPMRPVEPVLPEQPKVPETPQELPTEPVPPREPNSLWTQPRKPEEPMDRLSEPVPPKEPTQSLVAPVQPVKPQELPEEPSKPAEPKVLPETGDASLASLGLLAGLSGLGALRRKRQK